MHYRSFGKTGETVSALGFGMMRLPTNADGTTDTQWAIDTLRYAIDHGVNYVDTAYVYGDSEVVTGLCLQDGYREKVMLATKLPVIRLTCPEDFDRILDEQLARLQTDHIDAYLLHALGRDRWENCVLKYNILERAEQAKADGRIRYLGFSFHDSLDAFRTILNGYDKWDFCQIQLNYMDVNYQAGLQGLQEAHEKGLGVVIMEPLRGGRLAELPDGVAQLLPGAPVESGLNFLWDRKEISVVLSGMSAMEQVVQNIAYAGKAHPGMLSDAQRQQCIQAGDQLRKLLSINCTGCHYCDVCPQSIAIADIFALSNQAQLDGDWRAASEAYRRLSDRDAAKCIACGACVQQCPQQIPIPEKLQKLHKRLA
jgi:predicted aldo/keto reductase-like oxidoreductase